MGERAHEKRNHASDCNKNATQKWNSQKSVLHQTNQ